MKKIYESTISYIKKHRLTKITVLCTKKSPYLVAFLYACTLIYLFITQSNLLLVTIIKPLCAFLFVTIVRYLYNRPRPGVTLGFEPLIGHKVDQSFPSRHTVSAFSIAFALINVNIYLGCFSILLAIVVAASRIITGLHYISDVVVAIIISIIISII